METKCIVNSRGVKRWHLNDKLHCEDGPAIETPDGSKSYWILGKRHRVDGPAVEYSDGTKEWWLNGKLHRTNGPAIEFINDDVIYHNGKRYRSVDGPFFNVIDYKEQWWINGIYYDLFSLHDCITKITRFFKIVKYKKLIKRASKANILKNYFCADISCNIVLWIN